MKSVILMILLCLASAACFAQKTDTTLFNGVKRLIIANNLKAKDNYLLAGNKMIELGYNVGLKDSEFNQISTEPVKVIGQGSTHILSIYAVCTDGKIIVTGKTKNLSSIKVVSFQDQESAYDVMEYKKLNLVSKGVYNRLVSFAKSIGGNSIIYSE